MSAPVSIASVITEHQEAHTAYAALVEQLDTLHQDNALDEEIGEPDAIRAALATIHGPYADEEIARYIEVETACTAAGWAEAEAWDKVAAAEPTTAEDIATWVAYVSKHAAQGDEAVTLRQALEHLGKVTTDRLAA